MTSPYQFDATLPHCQWWLAITAAQVSYNRDFLHYAKPGMIADDTDPQEWIKSVGNSWNFSDRDGLLLTIRNAITANIHGDTWLNQFASRACMTEREWQAQVNSASNEVSQGEMQFLNAAFLHVGTSGFRGWDYSRGSFLVRAGYSAGWLSDEEFAYLLNLLSIQIQHYFSGWDQYLQSFIYGRTYWQYMQDNDAPEDSVIYLTSAGFGLGILDFFQQLEDDPECPLPHLCWDVSLPRLEIPSSIANLFNYAEQQ